MPSRSSVAAAPPVRAATRADVATSGSGDRRARIRLAVVADHQLVGQAVGRALTGHGLTVVVLPSPSTSGEISRAERRLKRFSPAVSLLLSGLESPDQRRDAMDLVGRVKSRWVLLTESSDETSFGALLSAGVVDILPMSVGLDDLMRVVVEVIVGRPVLPPDVRARATRAWAEIDQEQARWARLLQELTPRELTILGQLYDGLAVRAIAEAAEVSESTVRSQVKSIRRKLGVTSQLAAVAAYRQANQTPRGLGG